MSHTSEYTIQITNMSKDVSSEDKTGLPPFITNLLGGLFSEEYAYCINPVFYCQMSYSSGRFNPQNFVIVFQEIGQ